MCGCARKGKTQRVLGQEQRSLLSCSEESHAYVITVRAMEEYQNRGRLLSYAIEEKRGKGPGESFRENSLEEFIFGREKRFSPLKRSGDCVGRGRRRKKIQGKEVRPVRKKSGKWREKIGGSRCRTSKTEKKRLAQTAGEQNGGSS